MSSLTIVDQGAGVFQVQGDLTFGTIDKQIVKSFGFLKTASTVTIDLSQVANTDSAGLALMIEWIKMSRQYNTTLNFKNIPEQLRKLAKLSGFDTSNYFSTSNL